jgi:RND family efflux transporter MFP subunit
MNRIYAALALSTLLLAASCSRKEQKVDAATTTAPEPMPVQTVAAQARVVDRTIAVTGSLHPDETVSVSSEVPGRLTAVHVDFGQAVRRGQIVAELDKQELNLQVERAKASLAQALARLGLEQGQEGTRPDSTPQMRQAQAQLEDAKSKYENASRLVKTGDISQERFTEIQKQYQARVAVYEASRDDARTVMAQVAALRAEVKLAEKRLSDATIRAPFDGSVSQKLASAGQYLRENTPLLTIVKSSPLRLRLEVPESAVGSVKPGTTLMFNTDAAPGMTFNAVVRELNPSLDPKSRTLTAEARLDRPDPRLRPGMFVQVQLVMTKGYEAILVPKQAVYTVAGLTKVFVIKDGKAIEHKIAPGQEYEGMLEVPREAVNAGDQVAISNLAQLVQGAPVKATPKG